MCFLFCIIIRAYTFLDTDFMDSRTGSFCVNWLLILVAVSYAKTAEPIETPFGMWTRVGPRKHVLDGSADCCHLVNTIELSMCGGDAAFLSNFFDHLLFLFYCAVVLCGSTIMVNKDEHITYAYRTH